MKIRRFLLNIGLITAVYESSISFTLADDGVAHQSVLAETKKLVSPQLISNDVCPVAPATYRTCVLNPVMLRRWVSGNEGLVVDIRQESKFSAVHARGSRRIFDRLLPKETHLKDTALLIIDEPSAFERPLTLCANMRDLGFQHAFVLLGGINEWAKAGGKLSGTTPKTSLPITISSRDLLLESFFQPWSLISVGDIRLTDLEKTKLPHIEIEEIEHTQSHSYDLQDIRAKILKSIREVRLKSPEKPLVIATQFSTQAAPNTAQVLLILKDLSKHSSLFYLEGSLNELVTSAEEIQERMKEDRLNKETGQCRALPF